MVPVLESQLRKGILDLAVLGILGAGESYGYELNQALADAGFDGLGDATIYGTMRRMEQAGWVTSRLVASSDGPARKYYDLTPDGRSELREGQQRWESLVTSMRQLLKVKP
jgi:PadR family transcriptional regulator, regulatory protein PadR